MDFCSVRLIIHVPQRVHTRRITKIKKVYVPIKSHHDEDDNHHPPENVPDAW